MYTWLNIQYILGYNANSVTCLHIPMKCILYEVYVFYEFSFHFSSLYFEEVEKYAQEINC